MHLKRAAAAVLLVAALTAPAAQTPQNAGDAAARAQKRIDALHRESELLAGQERSLLGDVRKLEIERDLRLEEVRKAESQAAAVAAEVQEAGRQIETLERSIDAARPALDARLVEVYKLGRPRYARVLLGVSDLRDVGRATRMVSALAEMDQKRVQAFTQSIARLNEARRSLEQQTAALQTLQADAKRAADLAAKAAASRAELVRHIDEQRDLNARMAGELEAAAQKLQRMLQALPSSSSPNELVVLPIKPFRGALDWPTAGRLSSRFGRPSTENGVEIAAADGGAVRAVHDGRVAFADVFAGLGQLVIVDHGGMAFSLYGHLGSISVTRGAAVSHGQPLGTVGRGATGNSAVYFELRIDGKPVDPVQWMKAGQ